MFADVTLSTEMIVLVTAIVGGLVGGIVYLFKQDSRNQTEWRIAQEKMYVNQLAEQNRLLEERLKDKVEANKSLKEMLHEAVAVAEVYVNEKRAGVGMGPFTKLAPVVPEHSSPVSEKQQETADLQTLRASLTAAKLELGMPARESGPPEAKEGIETVPVIPDAPAPGVAELTEAAANLNVAAEKQGEAAVAQADAAAEQGKAAKEISKAAKKIGTDFKGG